MTSELNIWSWWGDNGPTFYFHEEKNAERIKSIIDSGKITLHRLGTDYSFDDIKNACSEWVAKNK